MTSDPWRPFPKPDYAFYRSPSSGLFLPENQPENLSHPRPGPTPGVMENYHVWVSWSDLYAPAATYDDVVARFRLYGLEMVLATLGAISWRISMPSGDDVLKPQADIVSLVFADPVRLDRDITAWRSRIADSEFGAPPIVKVFHELQVVTAAKIALLAVPPADPANGPSSLQAFGEAMLMVNDLINLHTRSYELPQGIHERADLHRWVSYVVPNRLFHGGGNLHHAIARAHDLYLTDRPRLSGKPGYVNLPDLFERLTGVSPDLASVAMFGALAQTETDDPKVLMTVDSFLEPLNLSPDEERAVFALFTARADTLREQLMIDGLGVDDLRVFDPLPLGETPVVVHDGEAYCPSVALLHRKMTRGLFYIFLNRFEDRKASKEFLDYMGPVFEDYIDTLLRRVFPKESGRYIGPAFLDSPALAASKKCDGVIVYEGSVVLIEAKATLLPLSVWTAGDVDALSEKIDDIVGDSAEQFAGTIRLIEEGKLKHVGADPSNIEHYLPLIVTLETMPNDFMVYQLVEQRMRQQVVLADRKAKAVQWADVGDTESLETLLAGGSSLHDILMARLDDRSYREEPFGSWLMGHYEPRALGPNPYLKKRFDESLERALEYLQSRRSSGG